MAALRAELVQRGHSLAVVEEDFLGERSPGLGSVL